MTETKKQLDAIIEKLELVIKLMSINTLNRFEKNKEKIEFLLNLGFDSSQIISITDVPSKTVYNIVSQINKLKSEKKEGKSS